MDALVGDFREPASDLGVGSDRVELHSERLEPRHQRHVKRAAQVAVEALNLPLRARPKGTAKLDHETAVLGKVEKRGVVAMLTALTGVALEHHRLHVVVQQAPRYPAQRRKRAFVASDQRADLHVADELDVTRAAVTERGTERIERIRALAKLDPVDLHLIARRRFESHHRIGRRRRADAAQERP